MKVEVSNGDIVDKVSILFIKKNRILDEDKLKNIELEYDILLGCMSGLGIGIDSQVFLDLVTCNTIIWDDEELLRETKEDINLVAALARSIHTANDKRAVIKREININTKSTIIEEKSYKGM